MEDKLFSSKEKYNIYICAILGAIAIFISYTWFQDILSGEEGRIRKFILKGKKAVQTKNILACVDMISTNYQDKYGNDRQSLIYTAKEVFAYYKNILIHVEKMKIELNDSKNQANVEIVALVLCQSRENTRGFKKLFEGEKGRFRVKLVKEDKKWQLLELEFLEELTIMGQRIS